MQYVNNVTLYCIFIISMLSETDMDTIDVEVFSSIHTSIALRELDCALVHGVSGSFAVSC